MLTRKQSWRKLKSKRQMGSADNNSGDSEIENSESGARDDCLWTFDLIISGLFGNRGISVGNNSDSECPTSSSNTASFRSKKSSESNARKKVKFSSVIQTILIPHRIEYKELQLDLWYSNDCLKESKKNVYNEMQWAKQLHRKVDDKIARKILYQPLEVEFKETWKKILLESAAINFSMTKNVSETNENDDTKQNVRSSTSNYNSDSNYKTNSDSGGSGNNSNDDELNSSGFEEKKRNIFEWIDGALHQSEPKEDPSGSPADDGLEEAFLRELFDEYSSNKGTEIEDIEIHRIGIKIPPDFGTTAPIDGESIPYDITYGRTLHPFSEVKFVQNMSILYKTNIHDLKLGYLSMKKPNTTFTMDKSGIKASGDIGVDKPKEKIHPLAYLCS